MGSKQVRLDDEVYARIEDAKREDETFSEAIDRLTSDWSLAEWGGFLSDQEAREHRALLEEIDDADRAETDEHLDRMGTDRE
ncbi:MAG: putative CopG family antitoxin [Haloarculaceae archaeon]|jgi:predicted CopG family antitoxin